ncbi:unnamed protein product [Angiostrongylus costaricensis]|uniref:CID domain-containing protein n=1 Tax=Angiostrongylus costaricensis TaxID=334426 RepID=A0A0R3PKY7_ANGCS|nr:unnamed protein product [Angiostrongylus costaricensis]
MSSAKEAANEYKLTLDELVNNNKTQINLLTILAEDYQQHAAAIVETIEKQIFIVPKAQKLPIMYVADSIMKNVPNSDYRDLFAKIIVRVFLHVFLEGDEAVRSAMYRLRQTWGDIFNRSKLYQLDIKVNEVDRAWPLTALKQGAKPPVITNPAPVTAPTTTVPLANKSVHGKVHVNPKFIQNNGQNTSVFDFVLMPLFPIKYNFFTYFSKDGVVKPTPIVGSHAFTVQAKTSLNRAQQQLPLQGRSSPVSNGLPISAAHVPQHPATGNGLPMPPTFHVQTTISNSGVAGPGGLPMPPNYIITAEVPTKLDIPSNNRIFVDGKAHEVEYVNDIAVIERNGLPHKIFFAGTPRNVILDGVPHLLHFGESKAVVIDGQEHILRFGAPSRELYLNNFAFRGQFGGAPIVATINGRRHEIRLAGPAPDVKINPDPAYELTAELNRIRASKSENKPVERRSIPTAPLKEFNMRTLKIRYDTVVDALHEKQQNACPHCGQRMELRGERYERHLDWHVKRNLKTFEKTNTSRPWYASSKRSRQQSAFDISLVFDVSFFHVKCFKVQYFCRFFGNIRFFFIQNCVVCCEEFEEYCDEDDDGVWKLKDCIIVNNQVCLF